MPPSRSWSPTSRACDEALDHHYRSQADRPPLFLDGVLLLPGRRARGAADPAPTGPAERPPGKRRDVQPAVHDARQHDGLPRADAAPAELLQLHLAAPDLRAPRRLPP